MGNRTATIDMGNDSLTLKVGNRTIKLDLGAHSTDAMKSITLKCGMSKIVMDPGSITIESLVVKIKGKVMVPTEGMAIQSKADVANVVKGAIVLIN